MTRAVSERSLLGKVVAVTAGAILLVLGFIFSVLLLAVIAVAGLTAFGYFWWKTRKLRKTMRERSPIGQVIDGEAFVVEDSPASEVHVPPGELSKPVEDQ
jgi:hypothetical protein